MNADTIFALSSGHGRAAIAVLRLSGPAVGDILLGMIGRLPQPRQAVLAAFRDPASGEVIDRGLVLFFPGPKSETGEDCAEFHCHGGPAIIAAMLRVFARFEAARPAKPGEFIRRSFENGKLDLTEVEGLADLVAAETEAQRRQALRTSSGALGRHAGEWRRELLEACALIETAIDFGEEEDGLGDRIQGQIQPRLAALAERMKAELATARRGERLRDGLTVVIAGPPNAGKSTLLNALARREAAIVSAVPGTTRDAIEVHLDLDGLPVTLIDTAGLRGSADPIESIGIERAKKRAASADLVLWLSEAAAPQPAPEFAYAGAVWRIFTKTDLGAEIGEDEGLRLSASTGENIPLLIDRLTAFAAAATGGGEGALITSERQRRAIGAAVAALERALAVQCEHRPELMAEDLRLAVRALEALIGKIDVEEVLGEIFARFCIGK